MLISTSLTFAKDNSNNSQKYLDSNNINLSNDTVKKVEEKIPNNMKVYLDKNDLKKITKGSAYALLESTFLKVGDNESPWVDSFKGKKFKIKSAVPIYGLEENIKELMYIFDNGYIILDAEYGDVIQYSYGKVDMDYINKNYKIYIYNSEHFAVDKNGYIIDGSKKGNNINNVKRNYSNEEVKKTNFKNKWGDLNEDDVNFILDYYTTGANEGTSLEDLITSPSIWLENWYERTNPNATNLSISQIDSYTRYLPEINQSYYEWSYVNDCAVISTLELFRYFWNITDLSTQRVAYNAIIASDYYMKPDNGVMWYHNDNIFKVGAEAIGKPIQSTSDDPAWELNPTYNEFKNGLINYGPGYLSFNDDPYGAHTVVVKGVKKYKTSFYLNTFLFEEIDEFIQINDHWAITSSDAYMNLASQNGTWYYQPIKPN